MTRRQIDYQRVAQAAEKVKKQGREPSLTNVCEELGIISPTSNLSSLLEKWYHTQPEFQRSINAPCQKILMLRPMISLKKM